MNCTIPGSNTKVLARAVQALAKIGDELFIEAKVNKLTFLTFNQSKTVCAQYRLMESFFSVYDINVNKFNETDVISCKIHMKTLLPLFKGSSLEKKLEFFKMEYEPPNDKIRFKIKYKTDDITMDHILCLMDPEVLSIDNFSEARSNSICAESGFYSNLLSLFSNSDDDIIFEISTNKTVCRNYVIGAPHRPKSVRSQVTLNSSEFAFYRIREETCISFSVKPFRTAISFAETFSLNIGVDFDKGGRPLSISMKNPTFEFVFIVATINPYVEGSSVIATPSLPAKITQVRIKDGQPNLTMEDVEAIEKENWAEFDEDTDENPDTKQQTGVSSSLFGIFDKKNSSGKRPKQFTLGKDNKKSLNEQGPESPKTKKAKIVFKRSYDLTFHPSMHNNVLFPDSDTE